MGNVIKERSRIAVLTRLAAVLVLFWSVIGGAPAAAHAGSRVVADWPIIDARCAPITPEGLVGYGCTKLSTYLQEARLDLRYNRPPTTTDKLYTNVRGNYAIAQLQDGKYISPDRFWPDTSFRRWWRGLRGVAGWTHPQRPPAVASRRPRPNAPGASAAVSARSPTTVDSHLAVTEPMTGVPHGVVRCPSRRG